MTAYIQHPDGGTQEISDNWILRKTKSVDSIKVIASIDSDSKFTSLFKLIDGSVFARTWESEAACRDWLRRPSLRYKQLVWLGKKESV